MTRNPAVTSNEVAQDRRWRKVGDPFGPGEMVAPPPPGELRDAGATVTSYEAALPRLSLCPVCGQAPCGGSPR